jgi:hypothetical protein
MTDAHTPGPWAAFTDDSGSVPHTNIVAVAPRTACVFSLPGRHKQEPDLRLIAAAPALLEALKATTAQLERVLNLMGLHHDHVAETVLYRGKDAITNATTQNVES